MAVETPDWLVKRGCELHGSKDGHTWTVCFAGLPQYLLEPLPAQGQFTCRVTQTVNNKRVEGVGLFSGREEALRGGFEALRKALGW